jgi:putative nucleotidyltransferase with HDIG domain
MKEKLKRITDLKNIFKDQDKRKKILNPFFISGVFAFLCVFIIIYNSVLPLKYSFQIGDISRYDIVAPRDSVYKVRAETEAKAAEDAVKPVYTEIYNVYYDSLVKVDDYYSIIESSVSKPVANLQAQGANPSNKNYPSWLATSTQSVGAQVVAELAAKTVVINSDVAVQLIKPTNVTDVANSKQLLKNEITAVMKGDITPENLADIQNSIQQTVANSDLASYLKTFNSEVLKNVIIPNRQLDVSLTDFNKSKKYSEVYDAVIVADTIKKGERIINNGQTVTQETIDRLIDLNLYSTSSGINWQYLISSFVITSLMALMLYLLLYKFAKEKRIAFNEFLFICIIIVAVLLLTWLLFGLWKYAIPVLIASMLLGTLSGMRKSLAVNLTILFTAFFMTSGDIEILSIILVTGTVSAFVASRIKKRSRITLLMLFAGASNIIVVFSVVFFNQINPMQILITCGYGLANAIIAAVITIGLLPFIETIFDFLTPMRLMELGNSSSPLLQKLLMEAPGTYHHGLMVGNLAEIAATQVGANPELTRVGALYHDIGKMPIAYMYKENQLVDNPHDDIPPEKSAEIIKSHTSEGVRIGKEYKLPQQICDIIEQHHGNTMVYYFYAKAVEMYGAENVNIEDYRYPNPRPVSIEAGLVMLADSIEAAVRSLPEKTEDKIDRFVYRLIKEKLNDGQLDNCNITLRQIQIASDTFIKVLNGMYHTRIAYPELEALKKNNEAKNE